jgi:hypothetical protein
MYEICYAYPSSDMAKQLNHPVTGCFYVYFDEILWESDTFMHLADAKRFAESTGCLPSKGSM